MPDHTPCQYPALSVGRKAITYDRWEKTEYLLRDGEKKSKYDFVTVTVPIAEFWTDFVNYWGLFLNHHDLSKWNDEAWQLLKKDLQPGNVALVMDASEAHKHELRREHQSAYFSQVTSTLWVAVLRIRVEDLGNITGEEQEELLSYFDNHAADHSRDPLLYIWRQRQRPGAGSVYTDGHSELFTRAWAVVLSGRLS